MGPYIKWLRSSPEWLLSCKESMRYFWEGHKPHTLPHAFETVIALLRRSLQAPAFPSGCFDQTFQECLLQKPVTSHLWMIIIGPNHLLCLVYCLFPFTGLENPREQELCISPGSGTVPGNYALDKYLLDGWPNECLCFTQWNLSNLVFYFSSLCKMLLRHRANGVPSTSSLRTVLTSVVVYKAAPWAGKVKESLVILWNLTELWTVILLGKSSLQMCVCVLCLCMRAHVCACMCE